MACQTQDLEQSHLSSMFDRQATGLSKLKKSTRKVTLPLEIILFAVKYCVIGRK